MTKINSLESLEPELKSLAILLHAEPTRIKDHLKAFAETHSIKSKPWFFPQTLAKIYNQISKLDPRFAPATRTETRLAPATRVESFLVKQTLEKTAVTYALMHICLYSARSEFLDKQTSEQSRNYCSLVPLIMSSLKKYANIPYSQWDNIEVITEPNLADAMLEKEPPEMTLEEIQKDLEIGLMRAGKRRNPATTYALYLPKESKLYSYNALQRAIICQTWCAHPSIRTEYMILDPKNWDKMPGELISTSPLYERHTDIYVSSQNDQIQRPWDY